ncbi:MAG: 7-cyano-7-deazaguanine synthase QueC [Deltaproteobacteria bacterium]|nr:7-cyano-7-deazaguanine synthase QueC [Deltaproteobacteria bacterium]
MKKVVVPLSGGLDSCTCATLVTKEFGPENVIAITILYGQKHAVELKAASRIVAELGLNGHKIIKLPSIFKSSALTDRSKEVPDKSYPESLKEGPVETWVPNRNMVFLAVAVAVAVAEDAEAVFTGIHVEDANRWAYPDCTPEFIGAMAAATYVSTHHKVRLVTPLQWLTKKDIVGLAYKLKAPVHLTYSCYRGGQKACGTCATCRSRLEAFRANNLRDPIEYASLPSPEFWKGCRSFFERSETSC